jgi:hypothetical protein
VQRAALAGAADDELPRGDDRRPGAYLLRVVKTADGRLGEAVGEAEMLDRPVAGVADHLAALLAARAAAADRQDPQAAGLRLVHLALQRGVEDLLVVGGEGEQRVDQRAVRPADRPFPGVAAVHVAEQGGGRGEPPVVVLAQAQRALPERVVRDQVLGHLGVQQDQPGRGEPDVQQRLRADVGAALRDVRCAGDPVGDRAQPGPRAGPVAAEGQEQVGLVAAAERPQDVALNPLRIER